MRKGTLLFFAVLITISASYTQAKQQNVKNMEVLGIKTSEQEPLYSIYPRIYCSGIVYVNDVPIAEWVGDDTKEGGFGGEIIINHVLLKSGRYTVKGLMFPREGNKVLTAEELMSIEFFCADKAKWKESRFSFHPKLESPWDGLSDKINYPFFEILTEIEVELPFTLVGWQESVDLSKLNKDDLFEDVFIFYQRIHKILVEHNVSDFIKQSKDKMALQEEAFYFTQERKQSFMTGLYDLFNRNLEVEDLIKEDLEMQIIGNAKLVRLMKKDGKQPLQFKSNDQKESNIQIEIKLHILDESKGLSII